MWEKINKISAQVIAAMIIIISAQLLAIWASRHEIPANSLTFINKITDITCFGACAWLFSSSKTQKQ